MAYRRPAKRSSAYSSADAYRSISGPTVAGNPPSAPSSTGHNRSDSDEDVGAMLMNSAAGAAAASPYSPDFRSTAYTPARINERTALTQNEPKSPPAVASRGRHAERTSPERAGSNGYRTVPTSGRDNSPLSPPRPFFLAESKRASGLSDRGSWSSASLDPASDSDAALDSDPNTNAASSVTARRSIGREKVNTPGVAASAARGVATPRSRNHQRRRSTLEDGTPAVAPNPFDTPTSSIYSSSPGVNAPSSPSLGNADRTSIGSRPPPSAFLPFQSHPGNPDPGMSIPGVPRRASMESLTRDPVAAGVYANTTGYSAVRNGSDAGFGESTSQVSLERPYAPFMDAGREGAVTPPSPTASQSNLYRSSAAGAMNGSSSALPNNEFATIPRSPSAPQIAMRAPFLSPASRPTSIWSPPSHPYPPSLHSPPSLSYLPGGGTGTPPTSYSYVPKPTKTKTLMPSTRLSEKLTKEDKPWIATKPAGRIRLSWWLTFLCFVLGIGAGAVICFFGWTGVKQLKDEDLCMVLNEDFSSGSLDANTWSIDSEMSGFGNGEFQMTTTDSANLHVTNGQLYLVPTLTSDEIGKDKLMNGYTYKLPQCSAAKTNSSACQMTSSALKQQVIPPVKSARVNTKGKVNIRFGKVEVRAKLPKGDWLWPAIWMLPEDDTIYGPWPLGGEMDIMEARGNGLEYGAQGLDFVRSSLNYGVLDAVQTHIFGWWSSKRKPYNKDFHTYAMEWTPDWMRFYVDTKLQATINMKITGKGGHDFFTRGHFPKTAHNNSDTEVVVQNIWANAGGSPAAPFDQAFYLILDLAAGGTSGWFPDNIGNKPWFDNSGTAMRDFALAQDTWHATWATNENDLAFRVDSVKMWKLGRCGN